MDKPVKGTKKLTTANTPINATSFLIEMMLRDTVSTAEVVVVMGVDAGGPEDQRTGLLSGYLITVRLRCNKKVQNLNEMWYKEVAQRLATQGDFGLEPP